MRKTIIIKPTKQEKIRLNKMSKSNVRTFNKPKPKTNNGRFKITNQPAAKGYDLKVKPPKVTHNKTTVTVEHREFVAAVNGTANSVENMVLEKIRINPGDTDTFEWLSNFSTAYEKYDIESMVIEYVPVATTITTGTIIMVPDYNVDNPEQKSMSEVLNNMDAVSGAPWTQKKLVIRGKQFNQTKSYLVRNDNMALNDYLLFDPVNIYIGSQGTPSGEALGQLFISYRIRFLVPSTTNYFPVLGGGVVGTSVWDTSGFPSLTSFIPNINSGSRFGNYLPNFTSGASFTFNKAFVGQFFFKIRTSNGFDIDRQLAFHGQEGLAVWNTSTTLSDTVTSGADEWAWSGQINSPAGGVLKMSNPLMTSGSNGPILGIRIMLASYPIKWWQWPSPYVQAWNVVGPVGGHVRIIGDRHKPKQTEQPGFVDMLRTILSLRHEEETTIIKEEDDPMESNSKTVKSDSLLPF